MKKSFLVTVLLFLSSFVFSQEQLINANCSWSRVLPGKVICEPKSTSRGFAVITDAKNLAFYSNEGEFLWDKYLTKAIKPFFSVLDNDFLAVVTNSGTRLTLINPDGRSLWEKNFDEKIIADPVSGRDSRLFIICEKSVYCFGITGIRKWKISLDKLKNSEPEFLPDGSMLVLLEKTSAGKSQGIRITPFGEVIEEITFSGEVTSSLTVPSGILLTFTDGTSGLFSLKDNQAQHQWLLKKDKKDISKKDRFIQSPDGSDIAYINHRHSGLEIDYINITDGSIKSSYKVEDMSDIQFARYAEKGILLCDNKKAVFNNHRGVEIWSGLLPDKKSKEYFNYMHFTTDNYFLLLGTNWTVNAFRTTQSVDKKSRKDLNKNKTDYLSLFKIETTAFNDIYSSIDASMVSDEVISMLKTGDYDKKEQELLSQLLTFCQMYRQSIGSSVGNSRPEKTIFQKDTAGVERMLSTLPLFGTSQFNDFTAWLLIKEKDKTLIHTLLSGISDNPYDPELKLMDSMEYLSKNISYKDEIILSDIINAIYDIVMFNGYEAIEYKGKNILTTFMYPGYSAKIRAEARNVLKDIISSKKD